MADTYDPATIDKYAQNIQYGTTKNKDPPHDFSDPKWRSFPEHSYDYENGTLRGTNKKHNAEYLNQQVRLNNLKEN